jgi:hypothetical protein
MIMKKKILSLALASAMALSFSTTAFAADDTVIQAPTATDGSYSAAVDVTTTVKTPTIKITVPSGSQVGLNPYKLSFTVGDADPSTDQVINIAQQIVNESDVPVSVGATIKATPNADGNAVLATAALTGKETTKSVFAYLDIEEGEVEDDAFPAYSKTAANQIIFGKTATTKTGLITLGVGNTTPTKASFKVCGAMATTPKVAWSDDDTVDFDITFTFDPQTAPAAAADSKD